MWLGDRLAQRVAQRRGVQAAGLGEQRVVERARPAASRRSASWAASPSASTRTISASRSVGGQRAAPVEPGGQELLGEERVALAAREQAVDQVGVGRRAEDVRELRGELVARQRRELDAPRARARARARPAAGAAGGGDAARRSGRWRRPAPARRTGCGPGRRGRRGWSGRPSGGPRARGGPGASAPRRSSRRAAPRRAAAGPIPLTDCAAGALGAACDGSTGCGRAR